MSILLTGFEPFGSHKVNPSWEVMKTLDGRLCGKAKQLRAKAHLLPVEYDPVRERVPQLWEENPDVRLCIHCGVGREGQLKLEQRARNETYQHKDNRATFPASKKCFDDAGSIEHRCVLDLGSVVDAVKAVEADTKLSLSNDAGLYLCEFTYFVSLHKGKAPTVFLHVPPFGAPYTPEDLKHKVELVVDALVDALPAAQEKARPRVGMAVLLKHADHPGSILVGKRIANHSDGNTFGTHTYAAPGGHLEFGETFEECARREVREECGLEIDNVKHSCTVNVVDRSRNYHGVVLVMTADATTDQAKTMEPEKCAGWEWASWAALPEPTFASLLEVKRSGIDPFA